MNPFCFILICLFSVIPAFAHPDADVIPQTSGPIILFNANEFSNLESLKMMQDSSVFSKMNEIKKKMESKKIPVKIDTIHVFPKGFMLKSNATISIVRYILKYNVVSDQLKWKEITKEDGKTSQFEIENDKKDKYYISFPKDGYLLFESLITKKTIENDSCRPLLKLVPDDAVFAVLWPEPVAITEYPMMGDLKSVTLFVRYLKNEKRPFYAELILPARSEEKSNKITIACKNFFQDIYKQASLIDKIPQTMVNAFTVTSNSDTTKIHIALTEEDSKVFVSLFLSSFKTILEPLLVKEKQKSN